MKEEYPLSTPEHEGQPEKQPFNVDAMSDAEIIDLGRALSIAADENSEFGREHTQYGPNSDANAEAGLNKLWEKLQATVRDLPARDLDRARELLAAQMNSRNAYDLEAAAVWADGFHDHDYELTRDTLVRLYAGSGLPYGQFSDAALDKLHHLYDTRLTVEQKADYNAKLGEYDERLRFDHSGYAGSTHDYPTKSGHTTARDEASPMAEK